MKRSSISVPNPTNRHSHNDTEQSTDEMEQSVEPYDQRVGLRIDDNANIVVGYSDNIIAACNAASVESSKSRLLTDEERREKRIVSNRLSRRRRRERHKIKTAHIEEQFHHWTQVVERLRNENAEFQRILEEHKHQSRQHDVTPR